MLRKLILFFILVFAETVVYAQDSYNYAQWGLGVFAGINQPYVDVKKVNQGKSFDVVGYYNYTPYMPIGLEIQSGELSGGSIVTDPSKRQFDNQYLAVFAHVDYSIGEMVDYEDNAFLSAVKDFYAGTGMGVIMNKMKFIQRYNLDASTLYPVGTYRFPGKDNSISFAVPIRFGYEFKIYNSYGEPFIGLNIQYVHTVTFNEELDGYTDPPGVFKNNSPDQYRQIQFGVKVNFGPTSVYDKRIN